MATDINQTAELFSMLRVGEFRPFKQYVELYKADLECKYISGYTPLMEAAFLERHEMLGYICEHMKKVCGNNTARYKKYINATTSDGKTALMIATLANSNAQVVRYLLEKGADAHVMDLHGKNVFDYAPYAVCQEVEDFWLNYKK